MATSDIGLKIRRANQADAVALCEILNEIIRIGGTTALETELTDAELDEHYISGPDCFICLAAEGNDGRLHGFQTLVKNRELPADWADIGTFVRRQPGVAGIGTALFEHMKDASGGLGITAINATIRADNYAGIPFYDKLGFKTYNVIRGLPLKSGTPVDRVSKIYLLR